MPHASCALDRPDRPAVPSVEGRADLFEQTVVIRAEREAHPAGLVTRAEPPIADQPSQHDAEFATPLGGKSMTKATPVLPNELRPDVDRQAAIRSRATGIALNPCPVPVDAQISRLDPPSVRHESMIGRAREF